MTTLEVRKAGNQLIGKLIVAKVNVINYTGNEDYEDCLVEELEKVKELTPRVEKFGQWSRDNDHVQELSHWFNSQVVTNWETRGVREEVEQLLKLY